MIPHLAATTGPAGTFTPSQPGTPEYDQGGFEQEEPLTEERMLGIVRTFLVTAPNIIKKPWLAAPDEELLPFVHELTIYCRSHDIDPSEYIGDWFPLVISGVAVGAGMLGRHREHKKETIGEKKKKKFDSTAGSAEKHTPVERKESKYDQSSGTQLPGEVEAKEVDIDGKPNETGVGGMYADDAEETADSEPSVGIL